MTTVLVTGASGTIGSATVRALATRGDVRVKAGLHDLSKAPQMTGPGVEPVALDWARPEAWASALEGVDKVFLLTPVSNHAHEQASAFVDAARTAGVTHIVRLSAMGADQEPGIQLGRWHRIVERCLAASGIAWTILRPTGFMQNFINYSPPAPDGNIYLPYGQGTNAYVDATDVGAVAALALAEAGHAGKVYALTGPELLSVAEVAEAMSRATGRQIRYVDVPEEAARQAMLGAGLPEWMVSAFLELHAVGKAGYAAVRTPDVQQVLGRPPRTFAEFARDNADAWRRA